MSFKTLVLSILTNSSHFIFEQYFIKLFILQLSSFLASIKPSSLRAKFENMAKQEEEENEKRRLLEQEKRKQRELQEKKEAREREEKRLKELQEKEEQKQKLLDGPEQVNKNTPITVSTKCY